MRTWKPVRADGKRECPECTNSYRHDKSGEYPCVAHFDYSTNPHRWCPGGRPPADPKRRTQTKPLPGLVLR